MDLKRIIQPRSAALFGISKSNLTNPATIIFYKNRDRYRTKLYCINPSGGEIEGEPIYRSIHEVGEPVDVAVFVMRAEHVPEAMRQCIDVGVKGGIVISGGFGEAGNHELQEKIRDISLAHDFPIMGPNGLGVYSPPYLNTLFFNDERFVEPRGGTIGLASQSGGVLVDLMINFTHEQIGLSRALSIGNKAVLDEIDVLRYFAKDRTTSVIGIYVEGFDRERGRLFVEEVRNTGKPVVVLKGGKSAASLDAVSSHTAAIAGDYRVFSEVLKDTGVVEVDTVPDFMAACEGLARYGTRPLDRLSIITMSGGHGVLATDLCAGAGFDIVRFSDGDSSELKSMMKPALQSIASFTNPIDLTGSAVDDDYCHAVEYALARDYVDGLLILFFPFIPAMSSMLPGRVCRIARQSDKPVVCYVPNLPKFGIFIEAFEAGGIPVSHNIDTAVAMLEAIRNNA